MTLVQPRRLKSHSRVKMITPSFGLTAVERVLPKLALDFTAASLDSRITFTRTTSASNPAAYVNNSGYVTSAADNQPRFDYDPITLVCKGLLIEEDRTNYLFPSEDISGFTYVNATYAVNQETAPDNTLTADKLILNGGYMRIYVMGITSDSTTVFSGFFKAAGVDQIRIEHIGSVGSSGRRVDFNLSTGQVVAQSSIGSPGGSTGFAQIIPYPNGWYKLVVGADPASTGNTFRQVFVYGLNYTPNGVIGLYTWGLQVELGSFATSYIPTTTTALTRSADVATITGSNFSNFWQAGRGGVLVRALPSTVSGTRPLVQFDDATADNIIALRGNTTNPELYIRSGGVDQATIDAGTISAAAYRLAGTWAAGNAAASVNSGAAVLGAPGAIPAATQARLGSDGTNYLNGHLQALEYYDERVLNAELQRLSSTAGSRSMIQSILHPVM
jgi:hypothetical protein